LRHIRQPPANYSGSYVRHVNIEARIFDPLARLCSLIDAQGRRQGKGTTVDQALIRGLVTA
jgi:hypothetical protein